MGRGPCAHGERATRHAPLDRHGRGHLPDGVASKGLGLSKLSRDRPHGVHPGVVRVAHRIEMSYRGVLEFRPLDMPPVEVERDDMGQIRAGHLLKRFRVEH